MTSNSGTQIRIQRRAPLSTRAVARYTDVHSGLFDTKQLTIDRAEAERLMRAEQWRRRGRRIRATYHGVLNNLIGFFGIKR